MRRGVSMDNQLADEAVNKAEWRSPNTWNYPCARPIHPAGDMFAPPR